MISKFLLSVIFMHALWVIGPAEALASESKALVFVVNSPGSFPYLYYDDVQQKYSGLVDYFFLEVEPKGFPPVVFVDSNQLRSEQFVIEGKADLYLANVGWLQRPKLTIASRPFVSHKTFLYSIEPFEADFSLSNTVRGRVCTHENFVYTGLEFYFANSNLVRVDSSSHKAMASMLKSKRCDFAVMNDYNAMEAFSTDEFCKTSIYQSPEPTSTVDLTFVMRPQMQALKETIDRLLVEFISSGQLDAKLASYPNIPDFPKKATCL
ncbi:transporter substrate-binding domain-containing protein [Aliiglaciecola sp. LCG003]|uniref:transporter substrate-binding domain-containing protein n=1 Tax=Aliiglaciecola sp. LCG003 TaxID=3053655 RepID=UPI002573A92C|nr:transporter substrate-binding domain-containing protein [Aliiglaciecola sp. LCG003]WJG08047.1 hypothetical protein QR722_11885 [Aliiglaciecola sp. LCG003]